MFRHIKRLMCVALVIAVLFALPAGTQAQSVELLLAPLLGSAQVIYVSDFDFLQQGNAELLFVLRFTNSTRTQVKLVFEVTKDGERIASAESDFFSLPGNLAGYEVTNIQLMNGFSFPGETENIQFDQTNIHNPSDQFQDDLFGSGQLPRGKYRLTATLFTPSGDIYGQGGSSEISVLNPTYIDLVEPGNQAGSSLVPTINNEFPVFQFNTDYSDPLVMVNQPYRLRVYKKLETHGSVDEVLTTTPQLDINIGTTNFQYPTVGAQPLESGFTYYWQVTTDFPTTNGTDFLQSPIFQFKYESGMSGISGDDKNEAANSVLELLRSIIGNRADQVAAMLNSYDLKYIRVNNQTITTQQLFEILDNYEGSTVKISDLEVISEQN